MPVIDINLQMDTKSSPVKIVLKNLLMKVLSGSVDCGSGELLWAIDRSVHRCTILVLPEDRKAVVECDGGEENVFFDKTVFGS